MPIQILQNYGRGALKSSQVRCCLVLLLGIQLSVYFPSFTILHVALSIKQQQHQNPNCLDKLEMYLAHYFSSLFDGFFLCQHAFTSKCSCRV
jgi:hypothetical protein